MAAAAGCTAYVAMFTHPWVAWASWALFVALVPAGLVAASGLVVLNRVIPGVAMATRRILVSIVTLGIVGWLHVSTLDGLPGFTLGLVLGDDTEYAPHYSARGFRSVSLGMGEEEVRSLVGDPLRTWQDEEQSYWSWSRSPHDSHYRVRIVAFEHGAVVRKSSEFYLD